MSNSRCEELWSTLRMSRLGDGLMDIASIATDAETGFGPVRLAIGAKSEPRLLVPCPAHKLSLDGLTSEKLSVEFRQLRVGDFLTPFVDLTCIDSELNGVFADVAERIVGRISNGAGSHESVTGVISEYRELLSSSAPVSVDDALVTGLLGELVILDLLSSISSSAIDTWSGPMGQRHDFRRGTTAIEVKTSKHTSASVVKIHGLDQLQAPDDGHLFLAHVRIERSGDGELSVDSLCKKIVGKGVDKAALNACLRALSCDNQASPSWNKLRCTLHNISIFEVKPGFPRILLADFASESVPLGVSQIDYSIDLSFAPAYLLDENRAQDLMEYMAA